MSDSRPALSPTDVLREALWVCEDFEGDEIGCGHADHDEEREAVLAALSCVEKLVEAVEKIAEHPHPHLRELGRAALAAYTGDVLGQVRHAHPDMVEQTVTLPEGFADAGASDHDEWMSQYRKHTRDVAADAGKDEHQQRYERLLADPDTPESTLMMAERDAVTDAGKDG